MNRLLPFFSRDSVVAPFQVRLTLREASKFLGQSHRAVSRDCEFLEIDTYPNKGGCLTQEDLWELTVFVAWKQWKWSTHSNWRGDRRDYYSDWETSEQRYGFAMPRREFDKVFDEFLRSIRKHPSQQIEGNLKYAAA